MSRSDQRMPKSVAVFLLTVFAMLGLVIWAAFNGHADAVIVGEMVILGGIAIMASAIICLVIFEAFRSLFGR